MPYFSYLLEKIIYYLWENDDVSLQEYAVLCPILVVEL